MPPQATGAYNSVKQALSIFSPFNKVSGGVEDGQGQPDLMAAYRSEMPDKDIIELTQEWKRTYAMYYQPIESSQKRAFEYWIGRQTKSTIEDMLDANRSLVSNDIFIDFETFLPLATRANPDPVVTVDEQDTQLADLIRNVLMYEADTQRLKLMLRDMARDWGMNKIGAIKLVWDPGTKRIRTEIINPKRLIFDKDGYVDNAGNFTGDYICERKMLDADTLISLFPEHKDFIMERAGGKLGTKLEIEEWWYKRRDFFFVLHNQVLGKFKNHLWNYDTIDILTGEDMPGKNHLPEPMDPYVFLSVYTTRTQPHDETTIFDQAITIQDLINRRFRQIDKNAESTNNGIVVNGNLNSEQASLAAEAVRKGGAIRIPNKEVDVRTAVMRLSAPPLADTVYQNLMDARQTMREIMGIAGSTPQAVQEEETVRGKILASQMDTSRIGGSIVEALEQVADTWFNKLLQIIYVYGDEPFYAASLGRYGAQQLISLRNTDIQSEVVITVKEGSMVPKDPLTLRNQAVDLWAKNGINPIDLAKYLEMPNPYEYAKNLLMWQMTQAGQLDPHMMFPDWGVPVQEGQMQPGQGGPQDMSQIQQGEMGQYPQAQQVGVENPAPPKGSNEAIANQGTNLMQDVPISNLL